MIKRIKSKLNELTIKGGILNELNIELNNCDSVLDVGCGKHSPLLLINKKHYSVGIDGHMETVTFNKMNNNYDDCLFMNAFDLEGKFESKSFDCVLALDFIEHFEKNEAMKLITMFERIARKKVILLTPNGFLPQDIYDNNPGQRHFSGWKKREMIDLGFRVKGVLGMKLFRGAHADVRWKPSWFWSKISLRSQLFSRNIPGIAFSLFCVKDL